MTTEAPATPAAPPTVNEVKPPPPPSSPPPPAPPQKPKPSKPRVAIGVSVVVSMIAVYALSLLGVHWLQKAEGPLPPLDLSQGGGDATIVQLRLEELRPTPNRLQVK